jgi:hypothetical protein
VGTYAPGGHAGDCIPCLAGTTDRDSNAATPCEDCGSGTYSNATNQTAECISCDPGRTANGSTTATTEAAACTLCLPGWFDGDASRTTECVICGGGKHAEVGASSCTDCVSGKSDADASPDTPCTKCAAGFYSPNPGLEGSCLACTSNSSSSDEAVLCDMCEVGFGVITGATAVGDGSGLCEACSNTQTNNATDASGCNSMDACGTGRGFAGGACADCVTGFTFSNASDHLPCSSVQSCGANEYQTAAPTSTSNRECATLTSPCADGEFESTHESHDTDRICSPCVRLCE